MTTDNELQTERSLTMKALGDNKSATTDAEISGNMVDHDVVVYRVEHKMSSGGTTVACGSQADTTTSLMAFK